MRNKYKKNGLLCLVFSVESVIFNYVTPFCFPKNCSKKKHTTQQHTHRRTLLQSRDIPLRYKNIHKYKKIEIACLHSPFSDSSVPLIAVNQSHVPICVYCLAVYTYLLYTRCLSNEEQKTQHNTRTHTQWQTKVR